MGYAEEQGQLWLLRGQGQAGVCAPPQIPSAPRCPPPQKKSHAERETNGQRKTFVPLTRKAKTQMPPVNILAISTISTNLHWETTE